MRPAIDCLGRWVFLFGPALDTNNHNMGEGECLDMTAQGLKSRTVLSLVNDSPQREQPSEDLKAVEWRENRNSTDQTSGHEGQRLK